MGSQGESDMSWGGDPVRQLSLNTEYVAQGGSKNLGPSRFRMPRSTRWPGVREISPRGGRVHDRNEELP